MKEVESRETGEPSVGDQDQVNEIFERVPAGQIWAEFYAEPYLGIEVVEGEELGVLKATSVGLMETPVLGADVERVWVSKLNPADQPTDIDKYFHLRMACPRCFHSAKVDSGEDYIEWDDYRDEADPGCWACDGTGEWELGS